MGAERVVALAKAVAGSRTNRMYSPQYEGLVVSLFLNRSLRTRIGLADACARLGASFLDLSPDDIYSPVVLGPAAPYSEEVISDIVTVLELHASCLAVRAYGPSSRLPIGAGDELLTSIASRCSIPLINLESDSAHPIQAVGDLATIFSLGPPEKMKIILSWAYSPKPKPVAVPSSALLAFAAAGAEITVAAPPEFELPAEILALAHQWAAMAGGNISETQDLVTAVSGANVIYMKSWLSQEHSGNRHDEMARKFNDWCATEELMVLAGANAAYMHCLPADRGFEVTDSVIDGGRSLIAKQIEMRRAATRIIVANALSQHANEVAR
jgi:N-acetylornithine carbamoyltransferase